MARSTHNFTAWMEILTKKPCRLLLTGVVTFFFILFFSVISLAQSGTGLGTISGTVTDSSGAVIPGAKIIVANMATGVPYNSLTNGTGYFEVNALIPGRYSVRVEKHGFRDLLREGITLETAAHVNVPLQLITGGSVQTVVVRSDASLLNTESGSSGQVLTTKQVEAIPVSGNNPTWLALIAPGVQGTTGQAASTDDTLAWTGLTQDFGAFGNIGDNEFSLDGAPNETNSRQSGLNPTIDELGETKFDVTGYDASVGHTMGVSVTQTSKYGTNKLHGTVRYTYTPKRWAAMNHFQGLNYRYQQSLANCVNGASTSPQCYGIENQYGWPGTHMNNGAAAIGGPVYIPGVFDGHNKLFFFASVLDDTFAGAGSQSATVPTLQERTGDFSDLPQQTTNIPAAFTSACPAGTPYFGQYQIYDPYSVTLDSQGIPRRAPFCGNVISGSRLTNSAMVKLYNSLMPVPTQNNPTGSNYAYTQITPQTYRDFTFRVDYKFTPKDNLFVRYTRADYTKGQNDWTVGDVGQQQGPRWIDVPAIGWDHIFSDHTNLALTFGGTNYRTHCCYYPGYDTYKPSDLGLPTYADQYAQSVNPALVELPVLQISNYENSVPGAPNTSLGETDSVPSTYRSFAIRGNITHVQGHHTIQAGAEYRWQNASFGVGGNASGTYSFDNTYTQENNGSDNAFQQNNTGLSYAAFLMGVDTTAAAARNSSASLQSPYYAFYAGDTWRVTPKLTIIPGLRYEFEYGVVEKHNQLIVGWNSNADLSAISGPAGSAYQGSLASATPAQRAVLPSSLAIAGGPEYAGVDGAPRSVWKNNYRFLPRLAIAYQVTPRLVVRGGYGLFYDTLNALNASIDQDGFSASTSVNTSTTYGTNFTAGTPPLTDPFPSGTGGSRFNAPIGSAAGALYYLGDSPTVFDHNLVPARQQRGTIGVQYQFSGSMMLDISYNIAHTTNLQATKNSAYTPASFYAGGLQPNTTPIALLSGKVPNPFYISNFSGVQSTNPAVYNMMSLNSYFTQQQIPVSDLVRAYPQMSGLSLNQSLGESHFQEVLITLTRRYSRGLTVMGSLQLNDQHDRDYFANAFDAGPSWEPSNYSEPVRFTAEGVYDLPFGRGRHWANAGWESRAFGGFQLSASWEAQPGQLVNFSNTFYVGNIKSNSIKIKHPVYYNQQASGGSNYVQWLNPGTVTASAVTTTNSDGSVTTTCTYSGNGFVTNPACQPQTENLRVFPTRVNGVRQMGMNGADANVQRTFPVHEGISLETTFNVYNLFNHQVLGSVNSSPSDPNFGRVFSDGWPNSSGRWLALQGRLRF
ncbi:TonB-dependent receptor domain-containing protein [Paracidobacterium acidisoli]|uniref:Carboxypeptidase regulatory-like domain-containing protein n=1 Tax=Paracidobacterium acidisoli TaxID=2303751 RepID=A0A372IKN0_9BACT|nr:carboxypeptidase-like regulatory domain-containing protein [Paracidobacterium acidisoli]MBT9332653.1 carboxypeptidase-like regulatory domain-containing protein [Paracidobacterium acidisoli]